MSYPESEPRYQDDPDEPVDVYVEEVIRRNGYYVWLKIDGDGYRIPWSQIKSGDIENKGDSGMITIMQRYAEKKGIPF